jgi:hypothetical protein
MATTTRRAVSGRRWKARFQWRRMGESGDIDLLEMGHQLLLGREPLEQNSTALAVRRP